VISLKKTNGEIVLAVRDNGNGVPEGFSLRDGRGMGSMLVEGLSIQLRGTVTVDSEPDQGSCFTLRFPFSA
jgi:two-component sensor histidine kinase